MKLPRFKCNWCGREYDDDGCLHNSFNITHKFGYESKEYDNAILNIDLCPACADGLTNYIISRSQIDSVTRADEMDWSTYTAKDMKKN